MSNKKQLFTKRFYPAGNYTWVVPGGCTEVEVFLVGAGGPGGDASGAGGGYTKTFRGHGYIEPSSGSWEGTNNEGRDGNAVTVTPGQSISIIVGKGNTLNTDIVYTPKQGAYSQFMNSNYRADGGWSAHRTGGFHGGNGGSGGSFYTSSSFGYDAGTDGANGAGSRGGIGQGHTTRDFGELLGKRNAGGGGNKFGSGGLSDYSEGIGGGGYNTGPDSGYYSGGGGGYGGGAAGMGYAANNFKGGDGTVLIRYWAFTEQ